MKVVESVGVGGDIAVGAEIAGVIGDGDGDGFGMDIEADVLDFLGRGLRVHRAFFVVRQAE